MESAVAAQRVPARPVLGKRWPSWRSYPRAPWRPAPYDVTRAVSALFPFKPMLDAMDAALNDAGALGGPVLHLALLALALRGFGWLALRRFA